MMQDILRIRRSIQDPAAIYHRARNAELQGNYAKNAFINEKLHFTYLNFGFI